MLRLRYLRMKRGLSQKALEKELGIQHGIYSAIETGRMSKPYDSVMEKLAKYFGVDREILLLSVTGQEEEEMARMVWEKRILSGKLGGNATALLYGKKHMQAIGKKGYDAQVSIQAERNKKRRRVATGAGSGSR